MLALKGIYENGLITLSLPVPIKKRVEVIVTFLEEIDDTAAGQVDLKAFSFKKSQQILKDFKGSLADAVIEERQREL